MFSSLQRSVDQGLRERAYIFSEIQGGIRRNNALEENQLVGQFLSLFELVEHLRLLAGDALVLKQNSRTGVLYLPESKLNILIREWLNINVNLVNKIFPHHLLHPWIAIFLEKIPQFHEYRFWIFTPGSLDNDHLRQAIAQVNLALNEIRASMATGPLKSAAGEFIRAANKNQQSLTQYVEALFSANRALHVIRIDLGYKDRVTYSSRTARNISFEETNAHRKKLLVHLRRWTENAPIGYAWKLEHGLQTSYRYHFLLFFNAKAGVVDLDIAKMIGEQWSDVTTEGKGAYFSWNQPTSDVKRPGTGKITGVAKLRSALLYMTRLDRYIKLSVPSGGRTFEVVSR